MDARPSSACVAPAAGTIGLSSLLGTVFYCPQFKKRSLSCAPLSFKRTFKYLIMVLISDKYSLLNMVMTGILLIQYFETIKISDFYTKQLTNSENLTLSKFSYTFAKS